MNKTVLFSIIIPVYNREYYLDRCLKSVTLQTYNNWEIVLVDDESTDNSWIKCLEWSEKDKRIKCMKQIHSGAGAARNLAIKNASGKYLLFLDSDDWWEKNLLEECEKIIYKHDADIIIFDMKVHTIQGINIPKRLLLEDDVVTDSNKNPEVLCRTTTLANKCILKRLFLENKIYYPTHPIGEDDEILPVCMVMGRKVYQLKGAYYNYDRMNLDSMTSAAKEGRIKNVFQESINSLINMKRKLVNRNVFIGKEKYFGRYSLLLAKHVLDEGNKFELEQFMMNNYSRLFFAVNKNFLVFGSYNLRSAVNYSVLDLKNVKHFQFSSIIAALSPSQSFDSNNLMGDNQYRMKMLKAEKEKEFLRIISSKKICNYDYVIIDFLEERFNIIKTSNDYITASDAYLESENLTNLKNFSILDRNAGGVLNLWKEKCIQLIAYLRKYMDMSHVILVRSFLMEYKGDYGQEEKFDDSYKVKEINEILEKYYSYFEENAPEVKVIGMENRIENFSDKTFKHGCFPCHTNEAYYYTLSDKIGDYIGGLGKV